jgi:hypothetical protein
MKNSMKFLSHILQYFNLSYGMYDLKLSWQLDSIKYSGASSLVRWLNGE